MIALTFDDGPGPSTSDLLDVLRIYRVRATFFVVGRNVVENPWIAAPGIGTSIVKIAIVDGHTIGNHTFTHFRGQAESEFVKEVNVTDTVIAQAASEVGAPVRLPPFRLPFGILKRDRRLHYCAALGRPHIHWSKNFNDWHEGAIDGLSQRILNYVEQREHVGLNSVLDLHDGGLGGDTGYGRSATLEAVSQLLETAANRRWQFFTVPL
jgi:peptidoglycan/xylan/chitin deacetylase (PgdA/CDA1 family)